MSITDILFKKPYKYLKKCMVEKPFDFKTRTSRSVFSHTVLSLAYAYLLLMIITTTLAQVFSGPGRLIQEYAFLLFFTVIIIPFTALLFRRLHDVGKPAGKIFLILIIAIIIAALLLYIMVWGYMLGMSKQMQSGLFGFTVICLLVPIYVLIVLFKPSTQGDNKYGTQPKD